jgi:antitoxin (DNA-binding transcriptional repressor) of toxin-antitoxin stability system
MKCYSVGVVRERLAEALDEAERGEPVFIERRGVRYRLSVEPVKRRRNRRKPAIEVLDSAVADGQWTWEWSAGGVRFRGRRR